MPDTSALASRIDAEFSAVEAKMKTIQDEKVAAQTERQARLEQLSKAFEELTKMGQPRLELLVKKFEGRVKTTPRIVQGSREVTFEFQSSLARVRLRFSAFTDRDVQKVIIAYDLDIIPVLMRFKPHDEIEFPLNAVDKAAVGKWVDDRIIEFVKTYFSMGENEIYLADQMVEDPIAHVRFPKPAAATTFEWQGKTYYFIGEETRNEFAKQHATGSK
jgi:YHS domain-containing protein